MSRRTKQGKLQKGSEMGFMSWRWRTLGGGSEPANHNQAEHTPVKWGTDCTSPSAWHAHSIRSDWLARPSRNAAQIRDMNREVAYITTNECSSAIVGDSDCSVHPKSRLSVRVLYRLIMPPIDPGFWKEKHVSSLADLCRSFNFNRFLCV